MKDGRHLDIGCGGKPRNPLCYNKVFGIDIYKNVNLDKNIDFKLANLSIDAIPYEDNFFDSISAYDFIEHIPRVLTDSKYKTRFPFIELMNEVWRSLKHGGTFYALTPAYPHPAAFQDPTHVNIITERTHEYFCEGRRYGQYYGFKGQFEVIKVYRVHPRFVTHHHQNLIDKFRNIYWSMFKDRKSHVLWYLKAVKE